ncbi:MAG: hypothetical protein IPJ76_11070 [Flavobacteriales bacterium]|nr:MAG: hypothetical protein IPJ76_11070 [Flavobacteriales bacterium]
MMQQHSVLVHEARNKTKTRADVPVRWRATALDLQVWHANVTVEYRPRTSTISGKSQPIVPGGVNSEFARITPAAFKEERGVPHSTIEQGLNMLKGFPRVPQASVACCITSV